MTGHTRLVASLRALREAEYRIFLADTKVRPDRIEEEVARMHRIADSSDKAA